MRKAFKINELGRSMVEMLGVLAVVGVLSIGAIQGYRYAFNKYNANETINELNIRAHDISQRMDQIIESNFVGIIDMEMGNVTRSGYPITARTHPQYVDFFEMFVSDVPSDVCKQILQSNWTLPFSTFVNIKRYEGDVSICDDTETVTIAYEFHEDLLGETDLAEEDRHELQRCNHTNDCYCGTCNTETGICETYCAVGEKCSIDYNNPRNRVCCPTDYVAGQYCCSFVSPEGKCCDKNGTCCPEDKPIVDKYGGCHSCDETSSFLMANTKLCTDLCENRILEGSYCHLECGTGTFTSIHGICRSCTYPATANTENHKATATHCASCPNRTRNNWGACYPTCDSEENGTKGKPLANVFGICYSCEENAGIWMYETKDYYKCKEICPNRVMDRPGGDGYCRKPCTDPAKPLLATDGKCYPCDYDGIIYNVALTDTCENLCPNIRKTSGDKCLLNACPSGKFMNNSGKCISCTYPPKNQDSNNLTTATNCSSCSNRSMNSYSVCYPTCDNEENGTKGKKLADVWGICHDCDEDAGIWIYDTRDYHLCKEICPDRVMDRSGGDGYCRKPCTDPEKPLLATDGKCYPCDYDGIIYNVALTDTCENLCPNIRKKSGDKCILNSCSSGKFMNKNGSCMSCTYPPKHHDSNNLATETNCASCPNRSMTGHSVCYPTCNSEENGTKGKPLPDVWGVCHDCDETANVWIYEPRDYHLCNEICPNRKMNKTTGNDGYCVREYCSDNNKILGKDNNCYPCNTAISVETTEEYCQKCMNREYRNGRCYPK